MSTSKEQTRVESHLTALRLEVEAKYRETIEILNAERNRALESIDELEKTLVGSILLSRTPSLLPVVRRVLPPASVDGSPLAELSPESLIHNAFKIQGTTEAIRHVVSRNAEGIDRRELIDAVQKLTGSQRASIYATVSMLEKRNVLKRVGSGLIAAND